MSRQIAVRLPDAMVTFLDDAVSAGFAPSRASLVARALEREMRRSHAELDAEVLRRTGAADDLDGVVDWAVASLDVEG